MTAVATTKLSSKGQIVIPESVRLRLGLAAGDRFVVYADQGVVMLKSLSAASLEGFGALLSDARKKARKAGAKKTDIDSAIQRAKRKNEGHS